MEPRGKTAFVVWMDASPDDPTGPTLYRGRVEHVASATRERFVSKEELLAFFERALRAKTCEEPDGAA
jgi:hypothetical protein